MTKLTYDQTIALFPGLLDIKHPADHTYTWENLDADEDFRQTACAILTANILDIDAGSTDIPDDAARFDLHRHCKTAYDDQHGHTYTIFHDHANNRTFIIDNDDLSPEMNYDYLAFADILDPDALADIYIHIDSLDPYAHNK